MPPRSIAPIAALLLAAGPVTALAQAATATAQQRVDRPRVLTAADREAMRPALRQLDDPEAVAIGKAALQRSQFALGALAGIGEPGSFDVAVPIGDLLPGVSFQALFTDFAILERRPDGQPVWRVYTRVPMFARFRPDGSGYSIAEYSAASNPANVEFGPHYNRYVLVGDRAWIEKGKGFIRSDFAIDNARSVQIRNFTVGAWPLALNAPDIRVAHGGKGADYLELQFPQKWRPIEHEWIRDYYLVLDPVTHHPKHVTFHVVAGDRSKIQEPVMLGAIDFEGWRSLPLPAEVADAWRERLVEAWRAETGSDEAPPEGSIRVPSELRLPTSAMLFVDQGTVRHWVEFERQTIAPLPEPSLWLPWQRDNEVWQTDERADHWDPPPRQGPRLGPAPGTGGSASAGS